MYVNVCASSICLHTKVYIFASMFFHVHYQFAADLSLLSASAQMFGHHFFNMRLSGVCKNKLAEQFAESNKSMICDSRISYVCF